MISTVVAVLILTVIYYYLDASISDWSQLLGGFLGGVTGSLALIYAAIATIHEQRTDEAKEKENRRKQLLTGIWAETRIAFEIERHLIEQLCVFIKRLSRADMEEVTASTRELKVFEAIRLKLLQDNRKKIAQCELSLQDDLFNLDFEIMMQEAAWKFIQNRSDTFSERDIVNLRTWAWRVLARLSIARRALALTLCRKDEVAVGEKFRNYLDERTEEIVNRILGGRISTDQLLRGTLVGRPEDVISLEEPY